MLIAISFHSLKTIIKNFEHCKIMPLHFLCETKKLPVFLQKILSRIVKICCCSLEINECRLASVNFRPVFIFSNQKMGLFSVGPQAGLTPALDPLKLLVGCPKKI